LATERPVVSGLGGDGEGNYGDGLAMAAKMVMERWTNYGGEDGDGAKLQVSRRWSTVVEPGDAVEMVMNEAEAVLEHVGDEAYQV
jgi:hypothetical protein